jgi:integron integrase
MDGFELRLREKVRSQGKAKSTADAYWHWWARYIDYCRANKIGKETKAEVASERFLSSLANQRHVSANTQNQAFSALCYVYRNVLNRPLVDVSALRAKAPQGVRDVVDQSEIVALFSELTGPALLCARMMYASSFRIGELAKIRIKDISFQRKQITVRGGKGKKDRVVGFPEILHDAVQRQIDSMRVLWKSDVAEGLGGVSLPDAWGVKSPRSRLDFAWWYLFASDVYSRCPEDGKMHRHHRDMDNIGRLIHYAAVRSGCSKRITSHCLRHSFATHSLEQGVPIHVLKELMGHTDIRTTETYLHVTKDGVTSAKSPLESLLENPGYSKSDKSEKVEAKPKLRLFAG